jgi:putative transposase
MTKLLTGYAVSFNHRHNRAGQLFQNRYKSIICQEDAYFPELVRHIHPNPTLDDLDRFAYSGHSALMGIKERPWQDTSFVLRLYGTDNARRAYHSSIEKGILQGAREDLSGGRSLGGWPEITKGDQRILGDSEFVMRVLQEHFNRRQRLKEKGYTLESVADMVSALY